MMHLAQQKTPTESKPWPHKLFGLIFDQTSTRSGQTDRHFFKVQEVKKRLNSKYMKKKKF